MKYLDWNNLYMNQANFKRVYLYLLYPKVAIILLDISLQNGCNNIRRFEPQKRDQYLQRGAHLLIIQILIQYLNLLVIVLIDEKGGLRCDYWLRYLLMVSIFIIRDKFFFSADFYTKIWSRILHYQAFLNSVIINSH